MKCYLIVVVPLMILLEFDLSTSLILQSPLRINSICRYARKIESRDSDSNTVANNDEETNPIVNTVKALYDKVFFYGLDKTLQLDGNNRSKLKKLSKELNQREASNPFLTRSEQVASAFIKSKSLLNDSQSRRREKPSHKHSILKKGSNIEVLNERLAKLRNDLKVIEISEISLQEEGLPPGNQDVTNLIRQKKQILSEINDIKANIVTLLASEEDNTNPGEP